MTPHALVVGASGPLGRAVSHELTVLGHQVTRASRSGGAGSQRLDATVPRQTAEALQRVKPDVVIYLARPELDSSADVAGSIASAVDSLRDFANLCVDHGIERLVFASSAAVYGTASPVPRRENHEPQPHSPYAALKLHSEAALREVCAARALSAQIFRIFNVYGPGFTNSLVNRLAAGEGEQPPLVRRTENFVRDYIHSSDVARAFGMAIDAREPDSMILNLATGIGTSNEALLSLCPDADYRDDPDSGPASFSIADISLIQNLWGFKPEITLEIAVSRPREFLR